MYTQCPECQTAFRVTAKVLQQAGGKVRCGGCEHVFSALDFLSEEMPSSGEQAQTAATNEAGDTDPRAETSRRLLETLDELAGPDGIQIEDTGVEWRVMDDDDEQDESAAAAEPPAAQQEEMRYDDNTPLPDDFGADEGDEAPPVTPQRRESDFIAEQRAELEELQGDLALSEPEDWTELLDEVRDEDAIPLEVEEELAEIHNELSARGEQKRPPESDAAPPPADDETPDIDGVDDTAGDGHDAATDADDDEEKPGRESTGEFEEQIEIAARALDEDDAILAADDDPGGDAGDDQDEDESIIEALTDATELEIPESSTRADDTGFSFAVVDDAAGEESGEEAGDGDDFSDEFEGDEESADDSDDDPDDASDIEAEDDDDKARAAAALAGFENAEHLFDEHSGNVETIIMEGEFVRSALEDEKPAAASVARTELDDPERLADTYALARNKLRGGRRRGDPPSFAVIGSVLVLALVLAGQLVHAYRETLATYGLFNQTVGPVYEMLGQPVTPEWNVKGWQFETTSGSIDAESGALMIVSRIANASEQPLPYPLVHVSLTDRFEEIMGSRILEPGEYLAGDVDTRRPVAPGESFTAVIPVDEPSADAVGFKLNVCYRVTRASVRCATEDFKN